MLERLRRRTTGARGVEFCDACSQVCTAHCRGLARRERVRTDLALYTLLPR